MQCHDCTQYQSSCTECFVKAHRYMPLHWAYVWDDKCGFFEWRDLSTIGGTIFLGHHGDRCPNPSTAIHFTVVDTNGLHATLLRYCQCVEGLRCTLVEQLMNAWFFPGMMQDPRTAFTFRVLKDFHLHNLESKKTAYDYLGTLRWLTDNVFTMELPVSLSSSQPGKGLIGFCR